MDDGSDESAENQAFLKRLKRGTRAIGHGHYIRRYTGATTGDVEVGVTILHMKGNGKWCIGSISYDIPEAQRYRTTFKDGHLSAVWELHSLEPLHVEPSIRCACGDHGWIRNGRWEKAGDSTGI